MTACNHPCNNDDAMAEFSRLYESCAAWLYSYLLSLLRRPDDADEVLQETAQVCWEKFDQYRPGTEFRAWACRIAHFKALKFRQQRNKAPLAFSDLFFEVVDEEAIVMADTLDARLRFLDDCTQKLPASDRKLVRLRYAAGGNDQKRGCGRRPFHRRRVSLVGTYSRHPIPLHRSRDEGGGGPSMNADMREPFAELRDLLAILHEDELTVEQESRIEQLVAEDISARRFYLETMFLYGHLQWKHRRGEVDNADGTVEREEGKETNTLQIRGQQLSNPQSSIGNPFPTIVVDASSPPTISTAPLSSFVGSWMFANLFALLIMGLGACLVHGCIRSISRSQRGRITARRRGLRHRL